MANTLNTDERRWVLKEYWKCQNAGTVRRNGTEFFFTQAATRQPFTASVINPMPFAQILTLKKMANLKQFVQRIISNLLPKHLFRVQKSTPELPLCK